MQSYDTNRKNVQRAHRNDVDPIFLNIAKIASANGLSHDSGYTGGQGMTFLYPTSNPRGYYNVLKTIATKDYWRKCDIDRHFSTAIITTLRRLVDAGLVKHIGFGLYKATDEGKLYLSTVRPNYIRSRDTGIVHTPEEYKQHLAKMRQYRKKARQLHKEWLRTHMIRPIDAI